MAANITIYTRTAKSTISGSYKIIDIKTAKLKNTQSVTGEYNFQKDWATFSGDKAALSSNSRSLTSNSEEGAPVEDEMVNLAVKKLIASLTDTLKSYAK